MEKLPNMIFINLPIKNLTRSVEFFSKLDFTFNAQFTDKHTTCMIINETAYVMLLEEQVFKTFTNKEVVDSSHQTEVIISFSVNSKKEVDEMVDKAISAGAMTNNVPIDLGFMYVRSFQDLDGHNWEISYMDPDHIKH